MRIMKFVTNVIIVGVYASCYCQNAHAAKDLTKEHGIIITVDTFAIPKVADLRHLPVYPGYEDTSVGNIPGLLLENPASSLRAVDVDYAAKTIYLYDYYERSILIGTGYNKDLDMSRLKLSRMHKGASKGIVHVAVDWLSHTVYWTDPVYNWIIAAPGQIDKVEMDYFKIIVDDHLDTPQGVAVDPIDGYLFWTDNGEHAKIEYSDLSGANRHTIITSKNSILVSPRSIETDIFEKRIYWVDFMSGSVMTAKYDGSDIQRIQRLPDTQLYDLAIFRELVLLTDTLRDKMYTLNKTLGPRKGMPESQTLSIDKDIIYGIAVYSQDIQPHGDTGVETCDEKNCEQMCISTKTGARCVCADGYTMSSTGSCTEVYHKAIVYANATHICWVDIRAFAHMSYDPVCIYTVIKLPTAIDTPSPARRSRLPNSGATTTVPTVSSDDMITMFDMNMEKRILYFTSVDNIIYEREMNLPITNGATDVIIQASGTISGLAYDAGDTHNLYWCESDPGVVRMVDLETGSPKLISPKKKTLINPRNLIVLLNNRKLAWIAGTSNAFIQTMTMDGEDIKVVYRHNTNISSLIADEHVQLFYFLSQDKDVYNVMFNGSAPRVVKKVASTAYKFLRYNGYMAWIYTSPAYNSMMKAVDYWTDHADGYLDKVSTIVDIKVLDARLQSTNISKPCAYENGNCSQICITKYQQDVMTKVCECKLGYDIDKDLTSCKTDIVDDNFILAADWTNKALLQIDLDTDDIHAIDLADTDRVHGLYFDGFSKRLIWSDFFTSPIFSSYLNGTDRQIVADLGYIYAKRIDKDMTTGNLYYTAYFSPQIGIITPSGMKLRLNYDLTYEDVLGDIVVHPGIGWMFYTVNNYAESYIARSYMDGTNAVRLIHGHHVDSPQGLAIDFNNYKLYWADATYDTIQQCDFDAFDCTTIVNITTRHRYDIKELVIDGEFLYYSASRNDHIVRVDLRQPYHSTIVGQNLGLGKVDTLVVYHSSNTNKQAVSDACIDRNGLGDCSTVCIPTPMGRRCVCEDGVSVNQDDAMMCENVFQCNSSISNSSISNGSISDSDIVIGVAGRAIWIESSCLRHLNDECQFRCPGEYVPSQKQIKCTTLGWSSDFDTLCKEHVVEEQTLTDDEVWETGGVVAVIVCLIMVIILLVGVLAFFIRRYKIKLSAEYVMASYNKLNEDAAAKARNAQISSPLTGTEDMQPITITEPQQMLFENEAAAAAYDGTVNFMYNQGPLSDAGPMEVTRHKAILTYYSWLKEKEMCKTENIVS